MTPSIPVERLDAVDSLYTRNDDGDVWCLARSLAGHEPDYALISSARMAVEVARIDLASPRSLDPRAWWMFPAVPLLAAHPFTGPARELQRIYGMTGPRGPRLRPQVIWNISQARASTRASRAPIFLGIHLEVIFACWRDRKVWPSPTVSSSFPRPASRRRPAAYLFFRAILPRSSRVHGSRWLCSAPIRSWAAIQGGDATFSIRDMALCGVARRLGGVRAIASRCGASASSP